MYGTLPVYIIASAADPVTSLKVGNDLNMQDTNRIFNLSAPVDDEDAVTWGYTQIAVNGDPGLVLDPAIGLWRQDENKGVYLNDQLGLTKKIGIGTNEPQYLLDMIGTGPQYVKIKSMPASGQPYGSAVILGDDYDEMWGIGSIGTGQNKPLRIGVYSAVEAEINPDLYISHDGKVGIGTSVPEYPLEVRSSGHQIIRLSSTNTSGARGGGIIFGDSNSSEYWSISNLGDEATRDLNITPCVNDTCAMDHPILTWNGNLGLGGIDPGEYKLNVASDAGANNVIFGDDLTVGRLITANALSIDKDANLLGALNVTAAIYTASTMRISGTGSEACNSGSVGTMRYYEEGELSYFEVCMRTADMGYGWQTVESQDWSQGS